jgi:carbonic anhydrase
LENSIKFLVLALTAILVISCDQQVKQEEKSVGLVEDILTKEERDALTPDMVIQSFKEGNGRFMRNDLTTRNHSEQVRKSTIGQYPKAIILSCVDSRVPVEDVFDMGI